MIKLTENSEPFAISPIVMASIAEATRAQKEIDDLLDMDRDHKDYGLYFTK